ncbi:MAG: hypothetical protein PUA93_00465 [Eubacteriales bacterium]|nr:hypothetical protein [Eubacteriales bacterium]
MKKKDNNLNNEKKTPENKEKSRGRKITEWVITILLASLFVFVAVFQIDGLVNQKNNHGQKISFGYGNFMIETNSMEPEYPVGTAIVSKKEDPENIATEFLTEKASGKSADEIHIDLVFYYGEPVNVKSGVEGKTSLVQALASAPITHRLINVVDNTIDTSKGKYIFICAGINTEAAEAYSASDQYQAIYGDAIYGKVVLNSPALGGFLKFVVSPWGLLILLLIPATYLIVSTGIDLYKKLKEQEEEEENQELVAAEKKVAREKKDTPTNIPNEATSTTNNNDDPLKGLSEEDKERLKQEMLEEMLEEQAKKGK